MDRFEHQERLKSELNKRGCCVVGCHLKDGRFYLHIEQQVVVMQPIEITFVDPISIAPDPTQYRTFTQQLSMEVSYEVSYEYDMLATAIKGRLQTGYNQLIKDNTHA